MSKEKVFLKVDHRDVEDNPELLMEVSNHPEIEDYSIEELDLGDFQVEGSGVVVERKTISDFVSSMTDGRLREQPPRMAENCSHPYILIEGDMKQFSNKSVRMDASSARGMMASVSIRHGIPMMCCSDTEGLVDMTVKLGRKAIEDPTESYISRGATKKSAPTTVKIYAALPQIGPKRAMALAEAFPSVEDLVNATLEEIEEVEGIGTTTAQDIQSEIHPQDFSLKETED